MAIATQSGTRATGPRRDRAPARLRQRLGLAAAQGADDRRRGQDPEPGVRRHLDLEDPLPRGPEAARAAPHPGRLPALQPGRRRAAARDPAHAARRVPAPEGDPPGAGDRRLHGPTARKRGGRHAAGGLGGRPGVDPHPRGAPRRGGRLGGAAARAPGVRDRAAGATRRADRSTTRPTSRSSAPPPSSRSSGSRGATCACSGPRPTARRRCSSSSSARRFARAARLAARRRSRTWRAWRRSAGT